MKNLRSFQWGILAGVLLYVAIAFILPALITIGIMLALVAIGWYLCSKYYINFRNHKRSGQEV